MSDTLTELDRVEALLEALAGIGQTAGGGVTRLAYSAEENAAFEYILEKLPDRFETHIDPIGNLFAAPDLNADRLTLVGSHLDTVYNGGPLDGALGVATAFEAVCAATASDGQLDPTPMLCVFRAEESARFGQHTIGSRGALGQLTVEDLASTDEEGVPVWQAMQRTGFQPDELSTPVFEPSRLARFLEVHIEQGRVLDEADLDLGIVTSIRAPARFRLTVEGLYDHSGATPMELRRDALVAASEMILEVESVGQSIAAGDDLVVTVGDITANNGAMNIICGRVTFPLDLRSTDEDVRDTAETRLLDALDQIADERGVELTIEEVSRSSPVTLDGGVVDELHAIASDIGASVRQLPSGGGHDAMNLQQIGVPTGLVFTPSVDGVSHNPDEATPTASIALATELLARSMITEVP